MDFAFWIFDLDMLEAKNIHKIYNNGNKALHVLKGIDLKIEEGQFFSIVGPSGAGKSTLLHILGGLDNPTEGNIYLRGINLYNLNDEDLSKIRSKRIGFIFQFYHLLSEFNALENVMLPAMINFKLQTSNFKIKDRAIELLEIVGLKERLYHFPSQLSGGEQQRVAIARALINEPDILLCDEPTGNLDSQISRQICNLLVELNRERKTTIVLVTHNIMIANYAKITLKIEDGRII